MEKRTVPFLGIISITLLLLFVGSGLASCTTSQSAAATNNTVQKSPTATATTAPTSSSALLCGTITIDGPGHYDANQAQKVGQCFWQAFGRCQPATLVLIMTSVDTTTQHTFTVIKQPAGCTTSDAVQHRVVPRPLGSAQTFICSQVTNSGKALEFHNCGTAGNIAVPMQ